ncbi:MAG: Uma2 family endonuclease [Pyrinomonadaceae bacterium]|jgi:Uma2 family endonuclease|nr:Uma2 family endonuclease [Pyrinomonadaceae bacterium]
MENLVVETSNSVAPVINGKNSKISYEEFLRLYDGQHAEYVSGEVFTYMSVTKSHNRLTKFFIRILQSFAEMKNLGEVFSEPYQMKMRFGDDYIGREPDVFFVSKENSDKLKNTFLEGAADLVIEVISPESRSRDRGDKFYEYETAGVKEYWIIDYERQEVRFYELNNEGIYQLAIIQDKIYYSKVLDGLFIKTDWLWQDELPNLMEVLKDWELV